MSPIGKSVLVALSAFVTSLVVSAALGLTVVESIHDTDRGGSLGAVSTGFAETVVTSLPVAVVAGGVSWLVNRPRTRPA
jgi:ABC-type Fe3+ transport system permease subunit